MSPDFNTSSSCFTQVRLLRLSCAAFALALGHLLLAPAARAQVPPPAQMCGDGTTFTVALPGTTLGIDDTDGIFKSIDVPPTAPPDSITLPNGCSLYVLLVSGYHQNEAFDRITFYKVAEFAAKHNGYVHVAWWNNLLKPYMEGPLHPVTITIERLLSPDLAVHPNPGGYDSIQIQANLVPNNFIDLPKANPDEDIQFQSDAALMIQAIKAHNPNALIIVAGHSMGADAVARLGRRPDLPIDFLAVIDPGNNRDKPRGAAGTPQFNWTRWRSTHEFQGYKRWDCVRNTVGFCRDFDPRIFFISYRCVPVEPFLDRPPVITTLAPIACPIFTPYADPGVRRTIGANVKNLYYRWQHEFLFPFDYLATERFNYPAPLSTSILDPNYQQPILKNNFDEGDPNKTCGDVLAYDPRRGAPYHCGAFDGHGEIIGMRAPQGLGLANPNADLEAQGLLMQNWPTDPAGRRAKMIEMPAADASWPQRPENPDLCIVCDDIIAGIQRVIDQQAGSPGVDTIPPVTVATADPEPNDHNWSNTDTKILLAAADEPKGSGVKEIQYSLAGAQVGGATQAGASAETLISDEGTTTATFFARDNAGNEESPAKTLVVNLDKTPPGIEVVANPAPNASGWNNSDVTVSYTASDALSGLAELSPAAPVLVTAEAANQEIIGAAKDFAGNQSSAAALVSIDKTAPGIDIATPSKGAVYLLHSAVKSAYQCVDALSGLNTCAGPVADGAELDTASVGDKAFTVSATDLAENNASATHAYSVRYGFFGFLRPVENAPATNTVRAGRDIPIRYRLKDANGRFISDPLSFVSFRSAPIDCHRASVGVAGRTGTPFGGAHIHYDTRTNLFVYVWKTSKSWTGCRVLRLTLNDGTEHVALFRFKGAEHRGERNRGEDEKERRKESPERHGERD